MENKKTPEYWVVDDHTYSELQKLKEFVDFVAGLEFATADNKAKAKEIKWLIENINNPTTYKSWFIGLDIYDREVQNQEREGIYWRYWGIDFELGRIEIEANSEYYYVEGDSPDYYQYYGCVNLLKDCLHTRVYLPNDINEFVGDARNYKSYITDTLNELEIDIQFW